MSAPKEKTTKTTKTARVKKTAAAEPVSTLKGWVEGWPRAKELSFDPESREPTVYTKDSARAKVGSIPWRREGDVLTILTQSEQYPAGLVEAAARRYATARGEKSAAAGEAEDSRIAKEETILDAWRAYRAASAADKPMIMTAILTAERELYKLDEAVSGAGRKFILGQYAMAFYPPMPVEKRGISFAAGAGAGAPAEE
jgi:hypothetical protein